MKITEDKLSEWWSRLLNEPIANGATVVQIDTKYLPETMQRMKALEAEVSGHKEVVNELQNRISHWMCNYNDVEKSVTRVKALPEKWRKIARAYQELSKIATLDCADELQEALKMESILPPKPYLYLKKELK